MEEENYVQFATFSKTYIFNGDVVGGDASYLQTLDSEENNSITLSNITITKTLIPTSRPPEEIIEFDEDVRFVFSGFFGEEVAPFDFYRTRENNILKTYNNYNDLPNFNNPNIFLVDFNPDPREQVTLNHFFVDVNGDPFEGSTSGLITVTLEPSRHLTRLTAIKNTLETRSAVEKSNILQQVLRDIQLTPEER